MCQSKQRNRVHGTWTKARSCGLPACAHLWRLLGVTILETKLKRCVVSEWVPWTHKEKRAQSSWAQYLENIPIPFYSISNNGLHGCWGTWRGKASKELRFKNTLSALSHVGPLSHFFSLASLVIMNVTVQKHNLLLDLSSFLKAPS